MSDSKEGKFYAEVFIKEFCKESAQQVWVRFSPQSMSSVARKDSNGTIAYDILFHSESSQAEKDTKVKNAFICNQDAYFCISNSTMKKMLPIYSLLLCKQQRLKMTIGIEIKDANGKPMVDEVEIKGTKTDCIVIKSVEFI